MSHPNLPHSNPNATIHSIEDFTGMDKSVKVLIVDSNVCNNEDYTVLDLSVFSNLKLLGVGDYSFSYVGELLLVGLNKLERVVIGNGCFRGSSTEGEVNRFYLKNCERVRELKMGRYSFSYYSACEIENVPSLEVIEMGDVNGGSDSFFRASLELKSDSQRMK